MEIATLINLVKKYLFMTQLKYQPLKMFLSQNNNQKLKNKN